MLNLSKARPLGLARRLLVLHFEELEARTSEECGKRDTVAHDVAFAKYAEALNMASMMGLGDMATVWQDVLSSAEAADAYGSMYGRLGARIDAAWLDHAASELFKKWEA